MPPSHGNHCYSRIGVFGAGKDLDDGLDVGETRLARVASAAENPIDDAGSRIGARLDAAMSFLDGGFGDGFGGGSGAEIVLHIGFESRLISLEGQQVVGLVFDDFVGNPDLAADGVDGDKRAFKLPGLGELIENIRNGGDFVGLLRSKRLCSAAETISSGGLLAMASIASSDGWRAKASASCAYSPAGRPTVTRLKISHSTPRSAPRW